MEPRFLTDTNVIIDYTSGVLTASASNFVEQVFNSGFNISAIVRIEVLGYAGLPQKMNLLKEFLDTAVLFHLDNRIIDQTILLRRAQKIKLGDAVIAATALVHDLTLLTRNTIDFKSINGLAVVDPYKK